MAYAGTDRLPNANAAAIKMPLNTRFNNYTIYNSYFRGPHGEGRETAQVPQEDNNNVSEGGETAQDSRDHERTSEGLQPAQDTQDDSKTVGEQIARTYIRIILYYIGTFIAQYCNEHDHSDPEGGQNLFVPGLCLF